MKAAVNGGKMVWNLVRILSKNKRIVIALTDFEKNEKNS
jgi:hypothetical protein